MERGCLLKISNINTNNSGSPERLPSYIGSTLLELPQKDENGKYSAVTCLLESRLKDHYSERLAHSRTTIIRDHSTRPSTAVRNHVKKISDDFTITQTNFENSHKNTSTVLIRIDKSKLLSPRIPKSLSSNQTNCSKCETFTKYSKKHLTLPYIAPVKSNEINQDSTLDISSKNVKSKRISLPKSLSKSSTDEDELKSNKISPKTKRATYTNLKEPIDSNTDDEKYDAISNGRLSSVNFSSKEECLGTRRSPRRRSCFSASNSPKLQRISLEELKQARQYTKRAIKEGRVFSIYGYFPAIRYALRKRGWVEKVLHNTPYVNPHPSNCVCFQAHCNSNNFNVLEINPQTNLKSNEKTESSITPNQNKKTCNFILKNKEYCKKFRKKTDITKIDSHVDGKLELEVRIEGVREETVDEEICEENEMNEEFSIFNISPDYQEFENKSLDAEKITIATENDESSNSKPTYKFNPSILCPEEIRNGIQNCMTEDKLHLYQYTVPVYEKPINNNIPVSESAPDEFVDTDQNQVDNCEENNEIEAEEEGEEKEFNGDTCALTTTYDPYNPYPEFEFDIIDIDTSLVGRLLKNVEPNFIWTWNKDSVSYKHLTKDQIVNRFPNTPFTTKHGLCSTMQQLHWFSEAANVDSFVPRGYCIGHSDERAAFIQDYRITACLGILVFITENYTIGGYKFIADPMGEVALRRVRQAIEQVDFFVDSCMHDHIDAAPPTPLKDSEWEGILTSHHKVVHQKKKIKATEAQFDTILSECVAALKKVEDHWPQLPLDGVRNVWIVKPGAQSRGRGIFILNHLHEILSLVQSPLIYETKYVVQKYIERPFLVCNTKFDIRQWFMVTDWNPLTVWMYKSSYVRFCSQQYDLTKSAEAIHLSNAAIQCKYTNGVRSKILPEENMWDCGTFSNFLRSRGWGEVWDEQVYPGMREALKAAMLAAQVEIDAFKHGYELFGADFMLSEDLRVWLIEINSSPCMAPTTNVTKRLCAQCLEDIIKVVVDHKQFKGADTGDFELIYKDSQKIAHNPPYIGVNLQITGKQISRQNPYVENPRRTILKTSTVQNKTTKPLKIVNMPMQNMKEMSPLNT